MTRFAPLLAGLCACTAMPALAQGAPAAAPAPQPETADEEYNDIVVNGGRPAGSVIGTAVPEVTLSPGDIRSFGVSSLSDLIAELAPQTTSGQGRGGESPVVLLGGKRISGFGEIRDIPTEAIQRVEILPEEVALRYGYRPNQKVVNVVLRRRFRAVTAELEGAAPTEGGQFSPEIDTSFLRIADGRRMNLAMKYERSSALYESERDVVPQTPRQPFDFTGNVTSATGGAPVDAGLSALLGRAATVVGVPVSAANGRPALGDFVPGTVNVSDTGAYRTLLPQTDALTLNGVMAQSIFGNVSASLNGTFTYTGSQSAQGPASARLGLPAGSPFSPFAGDTTLFRYLGAVDPLGQRNRNLTGHLGTTLNGAVGGWQWTFTGGYDHAVSRTRSETGIDLTGFQGLIDGRDPLANPFGPLTADQLGDRLIDRARSVSDIATAEMVVNGTLFRLPAGAVSTTVKLGGTMNDFRSRATRSGLVSRADLSRDDVNGQASIDLPIASRKNGFLSALGELSVNVNGAYDQLSDFGGLRTIGAGFNWIPVKPVSLIASISKDEGAPSVQQLGNPQVTTVGVRVFDYVRGETVDISRLTGGNPLLSADDRRVVKLGLTVKPLAGQDLSITANYTNSRVRDPIAAFPTATAAIEAAFPARFSRDPSGRLLVIDSRPINFARQDQEELRWGINFSRQLSTPPRPEGGFPRDGQPPRDWQSRDRRGADGQAGGQPRDGQMQAGQAPTGPGQAPAGQAAQSQQQAGDAQSSLRELLPPGPGGRGTRLQAAVYHTIHLRERILIFENGPSLDLLNGDAIGSSGGQPRHEVQGQLGLTHNGFGARLNASWQSGTTVDGATSAQTLRFSSLTTVGVRLFANLGQQQALTAKVPFLRGSRLSLGVTNLFNQRLDVRDVNGLVPVSYQPAYLDPLGRSVRISFRKLFF
ncbi:TonB-dependent receptor [Sphingomonas solaris]|uniref:TonB-dependent receptor n=1 Tax=Alterirhizorhabdus solaris TaxID=2529389 RepID=A0A558QWZ2_9SPHN|nr:TonB-dependent receptor [Sphingomonas solaris]TVV71661.1 TonB-dependent receptor [Sphingomonas solaris]